jgi:predicted ATPase
MRLQEAVQGRGGAVWLSGEAGIGKTRTIEEIGRLAAPAAGVLPAHGAIDAPAFWLWREVLRIHTRQGAADAARLLPAEIVDVLRGEELPEGAPRFPIFEAVLRYFAEAARARPLVFLFDDLHLADESSIRLLELFARDAHNHRWLVVGTYREGELSSDERGSTLGRLLGSTGSLAVPLRGLTLEEVARLVEMRTATAPSTGLAKAMLERSGGNPFYVEQLLKTDWAERALKAEDQEVASTVDLQRGILEIIGRHLDGVSEAARDVMTLAAILGTEFRLAELSVVSGLATQELLDRLDEGVRANLLVSSSQATYRFTHVLVRDVLRKKLSTAARAALHLNVGEKLLTHYGAATDAHLAELANHLLRALPWGEPELAIELGTRAAERETKLGRHKDAAKWWRRTVGAHGLLRPDDARRSQAQLKLAHTLLADGQVVDAREAFLEAAVLGQAHAGAHVLAEAALGYANLTRGFGDQGRALLELSLSALANVSDDEGRRLRTLVERALSER